ncbi:MAG: hypothetical protein ACEQSU_12125 [Microgenomates group bacterium]|jgi:hypothetical protein
MRRIEDLAALVFLCGGLWVNPALGADLPNAMQKAMRSNPEQFLGDAAKLIFGYGGPEGVDKRGVQNFVAMERAAARVYAMQPLLQADIDGDGAAALSEVTMLAAAAAADKRGQIMALFARADTDNNDTVTMPEAMALGQIDALARFDPRDEAAALWILLLDQNANGFVTLEEVAAGVTAVAG